MELQTTPPTWSTTSLDTLTWQVYNYTQQTLNAFAAASIPVSIVSIGNEIRNGLLWPLGTTDNFYNIASILHSAAWGVKDSDLTTTPQILIHLDNGWDGDAQAYFYDSVLAAGPLVETDFDLLGVSYYPFYNPAALLSSLGGSVERLKERYGKDVLVVETNWPVECDSPEYEFPEDVAGISFSVDGQVEFLTRLASTVEDAGGVGVLYWEPGWTENAGLGSSCYSNLMVEWQTGVVEESIKVFGQI